VDSSTLVVTLLTGGGFAGVVTLVGYLFTISKNKADAATTVSDGAARVVTMLEKRLDESEKERARDKNKFDRELGELRKWARKQRQANADHTRWDERFYHQYQDLLTQCAEHEIVPSFVSIEPPPPLDVPFNGDL
jgi:hypothetical protein